MRPLPAPTRAARVAAVQEATAPVVRELFKRAGSAGADAGFVSRYNDWQADVRKYLRSITAASFNATVVSDLCGRSEVFVEEMTPDGEWRKSEDVRFVGIVERELTNDLQTASDLRRLHAWHYAGAGEMLFCWYDSDTGLQHAIYSTAAAEWDKPKDGLVTLKAIPDGTVDKRTAIAVPREQVRRFYYPDHEYPGYAWSPMASGVEDLRRYRALARRALANAESDIAMNGVMNIPRSDDDQVAPVPSDDPLDDPEPDPETVIDAIEDAWYRMARMRFQDDRDIAAVAPPLLRLAKDVNPAWIKVGEPLDPNGIAYRREALEDFFRGSPLPVSIGLGGGVGDANHWNEWLATDRFLDSGIKPYMDRICHVDLTPVWLWPRARLMGFQGGQLRRIRLGYSVDHLAVKQDRSDVSIKAWTSGLISAEAAREGIGGDETDAPTEGDKAWLLEIMSKGASEAPPPAGPGQELPAGPSNVVQLPPARPTAPPQAAAVRAASNGHPPTPKAATALLRRLERLRSSLGTRLLAQAKSAYEGALRQAGVKLITRAKRQGGTRKTQVANAVDQREPLRPLLAAVGITELELLDHSFDTFRDVATREIATYRTRARAAVEKAGLDPSIVPDVDPADAVAVLVSGLVAMARRRLLDGDAAALAAIAPNIPRARPPVAFDMPGLPNPEDLAAAAARLVRNAIAVADGRATMRLPATADDLPEVVTMTNIPTVEETVAGTLDVKPVWSWQHGFYGEPANPFDIHADVLDGITVEGDPPRQAGDLAGNPDLYNSEAWPPYDVYFPGDHDGCTCEWVLDEATPDRTSGGPSTVDVGAGLLSLGGLLFGDQPVTVDESLADE